MLNVSTQAYGMYENGKREMGYAVLKKLAKIYNVSIDYILAYKGKVPEQKTDDMTTDEIHLISCYRKLSEEGKQLLEKGLPSEEELQLLDGFKQLPPRFKRDLFARFLSKAEMEIVHNYRQLDVKYKELVYNNILFFLDQYNNEVKKDEEECTG